MNILSDYISYTINSSGDILTELSVQAGRKRIPQQFLHYPMVTIETDEDQYNRLLPEARVGNILTWSWSGEPPSTWRIVKKRKLYRRWGWKFYVEPLT